MLVVIASHRGTDDIVSAGLEINRRPEFNDNWLTPRMDGTRGKNVNDSSGIA